MIGNQLSKGGNRRFTIIARYEQGVRGFPHRSWPVVHATKLRHDLSPSRLDNDRLCRHSLAILDAGDVREVPGVDLTAKHRPTGHAPLADKAPAICRYESGL